MKFKYTILYVDDVRSTLAFYETAFGFKTRFIHEAGDYGELESGDTSLAFASLELITQSGKKPVKASSTGPVFEIAFETTDVNRSLKRALDAGAQLVQEAKVEPWGQTTSYVSDANGFLIEICSPVNPS